MPDWEHYLKQSDGLTPHATLVKAMRLFHAPGHAIDLGCGNGRDTLALLKAGWSVTAVDCHNEALRQLEAKLCVPLSDRFTSLCTHFEFMRLEKAQLINAGFSLPFCHPDCAERVWCRITAALEPSGVFSGHFIGIRDDWTESGLWTLERHQLLHLLQGWTLHEFSEFEGEHPSTLGETKWWHVFHVVAQRPATTAQVIKLNLVKKPPEGRYQR